MGKSLIKSTSNVKTNLLMAQDFLKEQRRLIAEQALEMETQRVQKEEKTKLLNIKNEEIELKGKERELLIEQVENLMKTKLEKDVVLLQTGQNSNRFIRCIYKNNRTTLRQFLHDFVHVYENGLEEYMKDNPVDSLLQMLHEKKVLKKDYKPYLTSVSKGFYEEKPARIYVDPIKGAIRVETEVYITAAGANRLRMKELKPILRRANSI
ncbi:hypothetical protein [Priestia megaterium]|uniref:hypothetical protein n=1 Tax=Priestia megaterium TaxID=1404 RepID=UPI00211D3319|nr:hypothetical protein [Priestia megaterium]